MIIIVGSCSVFVFCFLLLLLLLFFFFQAWQSKTKSWLSLCSTRGDFSNCVYTNGDLEFCIVFSPMMRCSNLGRYLLYADMACFFFLVAAAFCFVFVFIWFKHVGAKPNNGFLCIVHVVICVSCVHQQQPGDHHIVHDFFFLSSCLKPF